MIRLSIFNKKTPRSLQPLRRKFRHLLANDDGTTSIEFVIWLPLFCALLVGATDISTIFFKQTNYSNISRDTARLVARHAMSASAARNYALARVTNASNADLIGTQDGPQVAVNVTSSLVSVTISAPYTPMVGLGFFDFSSVNTVVGSVTHSLEPT